jgi:MFS family permease/quinol monooxygenase YgiN
VPLFRALWTANLASNVGTWMQSVGAAWLMTSLTPSSAMVALVQTATSLPVFLVGLPAGALADIVDRRRLLVVTQTWMLASAAILGALTLAGAITPWTLLVLTFVLGLGAALNMPAWQASMPELVPRAELPAALALNGISINIARAIGPALGGLIIAAVGTGGVFLLNAASFVGVVVVLVRWRRAHSPSLMPAERFAGAIRAGARYVRYAPRFRAVLVRTWVFIVCGSALWALLPLVARRELGLGAPGYGVLLGCIGTGAVLGATVLPRIRDAVSADVLVNGATALFALAVATPVLTRIVPLVAAAMVVGGMGWIALMSSFNTAAQMALPSWVRARGVAMYLLVFQGGLAAGSAIWGALAVRTSDGVALLAAALALVAGTAASLRWRLTRERQPDLTPSMHWPEPDLVAIPEADEGPVLVTVEYRVDPERAREFARATRRLAQARRRSGAMRWGLFRDAADPKRFVETFLVESWAEHLRQHERVTVSDRAAQDRVRAFHEGGEPPVVTHLIAFRDREA